MTYLNEIFMLYFNGILTRFLCVLLSTEEILMGCINFNFKQHCFIDPRNLPGTSKAEG